MTLITFHLNNEPTSVQVDPATPLLDVLRDELGMGRDGDTIMVLVEPPVLPTPTPDTASPSTADAPRVAGPPEGETDVPTWRQWWDLFAEGRR